MRALLRTGATSVAILLAVAAGAQADAGPNDQARAKDAYERGSIAYRAGEYARAAAEFATADALAPNAVTLRAALEAATLADDPVLGTELLGRVDRTPADRALASVAATARVRFAHRTGRIVVRCPQASRCLATIDGSAAEAGKPRVVAVGQHNVTLQGDGAVEQRMVQVAADGTADVAPTVETSAPQATLETMPSTTPASSQADTGLSPTWFFAALAVTGVVGGLTVWSALDTSSKHAQFEDQCGHPPAAPGCGDLQNTGLAAQQRTNAFLIGTAALAVGTAALGLFLVHWHPRGDASVGLVLHANQASLHATF